VTIERMFGYPPAGTEEEEVADHKLQLTVKSTSGEFTDEFNTSNKADKVLDRAIKEFGLSTGGTVTYILRRAADGRTLALSEKLGDLQLVDGDVILVQTNQAKDG
jgi:hypothetical protein